MRIGKLSSEELKQVVLSKTSSNNAEVLQSAGLAEDCSAIKSDKVLLLTTDPITATGKNAGRLAIAISANDIAVSGGIPKCCLLTIIAPTDSSVDDIDKFMSEAHEMANSLNIDIIGGHTEFSSAVNRMIVSCTMIGTTKKVIKTSGAKVGDSIVMTKTAGIEGTSIVAHDYADKLLKGGLTENELAEAKNYIDKIPAILDASVASKCDIHSMHDVTEGGIYGAVTELAETSDLGATIYSDKIPVTNLTKKICKILGISPMRLIGSGSIIMVTPEPEKVISSLKKLKIEGTVIGTMRSNHEVTAIGEGNSENLEVTPDELLLIK